MRTLLTVLAWGLLLAACKDSTGTERGPEGIYDLVAVDGEPFDVEILDQSFLRRVRRGEVQLLPESPSVLTCNAGNADPGATSS